MPDSRHSYEASRLTRIEPDDRIVVLARTIQALGPQAEIELKDRAVNWSRFGETCLGQALYRHRSVFQSGSEAAVWSHLELSYFRDIIPVEAIHELVIKRRRPAVQLLRAEILLTTPSAFVLPQNWRGAAHQPEWQASLEYIEVLHPHLSDYREIMRTYIGPAAATVVQTGKIGTFRAMETATVLYRDPELKTDWNQIHLCELDANRFKGFSHEFETALGEVSPGASVFAGLDRMRTIPRWTLNDPVLEADTAVGHAAPLERL